MSRPYPFPDDAGIEPSLMELLTDPTLHLLLARDGLVVADVCALIDTWQRAHPGTAKRIDAAA